MALPYRHLISFSGCCRKKSLLFLSFYFFINDLIMFYRGRRDTHKHIGHRSSEHRLESDCYQKITTQSLKLVVEESVLRSILCSRAGMTLKVR
jgi:hypothetical protein